MDFVDRILTCTDCGGEFIFTAGEQLFFLDKQFKNDPKRCKPCKSRRGAQGASAATGSGPAAAGISRTETRTECSECGIETTVPFKPTQGRPVLCRQCYKNKMSRRTRPRRSPPRLPQRSPYRPSSRDRRRHGVCVARSQRAAREARRQPPQPEFAAADVSMAI